MASRALDPCIESRQMPYINNGKSAIPHKLTNHLPCQSPPAPSVEESVAPALSSSGKSETTKLDRMR